MTSYKACVHAHTHPPTHTHTHTWSFWYGLGNHQEDTHQVPNITSVLHIHNLFSRWMQFIFHPYTEWDLRKVCVCVCLCGCWVDKKHLVFIWDWFWTRFMDNTNCAEECWAYGWWDTQEDELRDSANQLPITWQRYRDAWQMSEGNKIHDITGELCIVWSHAAAMLARHSLQSVYGSKKTWFFWVFFWQNCQSKGSSYNGNSYSNPCLQQRWVLQQQQQQGCYDITNHYNNDSGTIKSVNKKSL
jgi:hypothetical protein